MDKLSGRKTLRVAGILDEFEKDRIKARIDIVSLFADCGVELAAKGKNFLGRCPWHEDGTPSLSVDREKGLYNCFGCGESGDAFTLIEKMKGLDFKGALSYLKTKTDVGVLVPLPSPPKTPEVARSTDRATSGVKVQVLPGDEAARAQVETASFNADAQSLLDAVASWYARGLMQSKDAQGYLSGRALGNAELQRRFGIGYAEGKLSTVVAGSDKKALQDLGIFRSDGSEFFSGCVVVPLRDDQGRTVSFYGRKIDERTPKHLYLKGKHQGLVNGQAAAVYPEELILTESIIDALSLLALGIENVIPCYGTHGFTEDHRAALSEARVKSVVLAFDADEAGRKGAHALAESLNAAGIRVKRIEPSLGKDWNEFLSAGGKTETVHALIEAATLEGVQDPDALNVSRDGRRWVFRSGDLVYRVLPGAEVFVSSLRVNIRAEVSPSIGGASELFLDNCDLYSARARSGFAANLSRRAGIESARIEKDLLAIVQRLETERDKALEEANPRVEPCAPTAIERAEAEAFLKRPSLFSDIASDLDAVGYVGEEENKLVVYLAGVSRLLEKPLSVYIQAGSASGKSFLIETVRRLLPPESVLAISSFSDQALNYMKQDDLHGKVMLLGEAIHNELVEGQIRQMQSEGELSRLVVVKDPKTGELESRQVRNKVRLAFMMSSTALYLNPENASRCLVLHTDESRAQTERILSVQRSQKTFDGRMHSGYQIPRIVSRHQTIGRILETLSVFNPLSPLLRFPAGRPAMRRAQDHFFTLLEAVALLRQYQKKRVEKVNPFTGEALSGIEVDLEDYRIARKLLCDAVLSPNADELPSGARLLFSTIQGMAKKKAALAGLASEDVSFIQRDIRELSELGSDSIKKYLRSLVDFEYLELVSGRKQGTRFSYRLRTQGPDAGVGIDLPEPEEIERLRSETGEAGKSGEFPSCEEKKL